MNNIDDSEMKNPLIPDESLLSEKFSRRSFMKGFAATTAAVSLSTILPATILADKKEEAEADSAEAYASGNGIYIDGGNVNMNGKTYTLEFTQPVQLKAVVGGKEQTEGVWRSNYRHLVSVDPNGTVRMRDGVGGYDVDVTWTRDGISYKVTFHTGQTAGGYSIDVDAPMTRGEFMIRLADYFGWCHYNNVMDDGSDINDDGSYAEKERVRNYYDVTGNADYVKPIEAALDMGAIHADSPDECFYPMSYMSRQDAAVIIRDAFKIPDCDVDYIAAFEDADQIDPDCYAALNALVGHNYMRGRTNMTLNPTDDITDTEARIIIENIDGAVSAPVWCMPVSNRKFVRIRPYFQCPDKDATLHYRHRVVKVSDERLIGLKSQDAVMANDGDWTDWIDFIPDYTIDPFFGFQSCNWLPYDKIWYVVELEVYSSKPGKQDSSVSKYIWRIERPAWHDFAFDKLHEGTKDYPTVYRFFDNFQAAAYYIEGSKSGILYDGLMPTNTSTTLIDYVKEHCATKPFVFVLGHEHGDHNGAMPPAYDKGIPVYVCDRVGSQEGKSWTYRFRSHDYINDDADTETFTGTYENSEEHPFIHIDEGFVFDLGNCKFETYRLPGHEDAMLLLYDRAHGLLFSSDIYGVNRYWVADQFSAKGVRQDLVLSLHQQLMEEYAKGGAKVKELYTGHNRIGVGPDYLMVWEQALQDIIDWGDPAYKDDRRGDGAILARNGFSLDTMNWQGFTENGKMRVAEYEGQYTGETFRRIELDHVNSDGKTADVSSNLYFDRDSVTALSNVSFRDAKLVGHDFRYKAGQNSEFTELEDGRLKYVVPNKFVPFEYDYEVVIAPGQEKVTFTPVAMSNRYRSLTVNGKPVSSRCPVTVPTDEPVKIVCVGPDGTEPEQPYVFTFVTEE
jgi:glyoxylase-like metal-dependent hydrolase (beta-lactamase superfamily II)